MAYTSPVVIIEEATKSFIEQKEDKIMSEISLKYGVEINKEELKKALHYDRGQYNKGFEDALEEVRQIIKDILICPTPKNRPIKNTSKQAVYDAMYEIVKLVSRSV